MAAKGPRTDGRETIWQAMRKMSEFTLQGLVKSSGQKLGAVQDYATGLRRAGFVEACGKLENKDNPGAYGRTLYRLIKDVGVDAPRVRKDGTLLPPMGRDRMWRAMRILKEFSALDLAVAASLSESPVRESEAQAYCLFLARAGYLFETEKGKRYRFLSAQYHGPKAPMIRRIKDVVDGNTGEVRWQSEPREVAS